MVQQQQGRANIAAHQAAHDSVAYCVMMGESAAHSSMSTSVSNEQSPSAGCKRDNVVYWKTKRKIKDDLQWL